MKSKKKAVKKTKKRTKKFDLIYALEKYSIPDTSPMGMEIAGLVEAFRVKSTHPYIKDEIWYRRG